MGDAGDVNERFGLRIGNEDPLPVPVVPVLIDLTGEVDRFPLGLPSGELGRFACRRSSVPKFLRWQVLLIISCKKKDISKRFGEPIRLQNCR